MLVLTLEKHEIVRIGDVTIRVSKERGRMRWYIDHATGGPVMVSRDGKWRAVVATDKAVSRVD